MPGNEWIGKEERDAVTDVMDRGAVFFRYGFDERRKNVFKVREFEQKFAAYLGCEHAQAVSSGSTALRVALGALGIGSGHEVIVPCFTFVATVEAVLESGAIPVVSEIDGTLNMDPDDIEKRITPRTKAIMPVHMLGVAADMNRIMDIARKHNLFVIEDTAQACGSSYFGKKAGTIGDAGTFSFDYVKTLTCGEGGMVATRSHETYERASQFADHGHKHDPSVPRGLDGKDIYGFNCRMTEIAAAVGLCQLAKLDSMISRQRQHKLAIKNALTDLKGVSFRDMADSQGDGCDTVVLRFLNPAKAKAFAEGVAGEKVGFKILPDALGWHFFGNWPQIIQRIKKYSKKPPEKLFAKSRKLLNQCVALPISLEMNTDSVIDRLRRIVKEVL